MGDIALNLNFDMLGSPNFILGTFDSETIPGNSSEFTRARQGSSAIQEAFRDYYSSTTPSVQLDETLEFNFRSDYGPFLEQAIPCGGLETGAEKLKTSRQREMFGGMANVAL